MKRAGRTLALRHCPRRQAPSSGFSRAAPRQPRGRSSRKALAAAGAARVQHLAASDRLHARAKAMAAFANELARLIGPLHVINSKSRDFTGESAIGFPNKPTPDLAAPPPHLEPSDEPGKCLAAASPSRGGAYRRAARAKSIARGRGRRHFPAGVLDFKNLRRNFPRFRFAAPGKATHLDKDGPSAATAPRDAHATRSTFDKPPSGLGWSPRMTRLRPSALAR